MSVTINEFIKIDPKYNTVQNNLKATAANLDVWLYEVMKRVELIEKDNENLRKEVEELKETNVNKDEVIAELKGAVEATKEENIWTNVVKKNQKRSDEQKSMLIATTNESKEQIQREKNIIVFGITESKEDSLEKRDKEDNIKIEEILKKVDVSMEKIKKVIRFKKKSSNTAPSPILLVLEDKNSRNQILSKTRGLDATNKIFFNSDLTEAQRLEQKNLRADMKNKNLRNKNEQIYFSIRNGKVVTKKKETETV